MIKENYRESFLFAGLERLLLPVTAINIRRCSFKLVQDKTTKMEALQNTIIHDKYEMNLHICKNTNSIYFLGSNRITLKPAETFWSVFDMKCNILKFFQSYFRLDSWILSAWFVCIPLINTVYTSYATLCASSCIQFSPYLPSLYTHRKVSEKNPQVTMQMLISGMGKMLT